MHSHLHSPSSAIFAAILAQFASAQSAPQDPPVAPSFAVSARAVGLDTVDGVPWATGPGYKASFTGTGVTFVPALGRRSPRQRELQFTLTAFGREHGPMQPAGPAAPLQGELCVDYRRGQVVESYGVTAAGIEQSFTFAQLPPGSGDLVVTGRIATDLAFQQAAPDHLCFADPELGGVFLRNVTGIDGKQQRSRGTLRRVGTDSDGNHLVELRLPAAFVDRAALPLVLDPLIGTMITASGGPDDEYQDVAYEPTNDIWLVIWSHSFSLLNIDLRGQRVSGNGTLVGNLITIRSGVIGLSYIRLATVDARDTFVAVWYEATPTLQALAAAVHAGTGAVSPPLLLTPGAASGSAPVVAAASDAGDAVVIAWNDEPAAMVRGARVTVSPAGTLSAGPTVNLCPPGGGGGPRLPRTGGADGRLLLTYVAANSRIEGVVIDQNLQILATVNVVPTWPSTTAFVPGNVDGDGRNWLLVYEVGGHYFRGDIFCRKVTFDVASNQATVGAEVPVANSTTVAEFGSSVAWLGSSAAIVYTVATNWPNPGWTASIVVRTIDAFGCTPCEQPVTVVTRTGPHAADNSRIAGRPGSNGSAPRALLTFMDQPPNNTINLLAHLFRADDGLEWDRAGGCSGGGSARHGCAAVGNGGYSLRLQDAPAQAPVFLVLGTARADFACGPCTVVPDPFTGASLFAGVSSGAGSAAWSLPIPAGAAFRGLTFFHQWCTLASSGGCFGLALSNALEVQLQ